MCLQTITTDGLKGRKIGYRKSGVVVKRRNFRVKALGDKMIKKEEVQVRS